MSKIDSIPEKLIYVYSKSTCIDGELVYPTFIADANKPKTIETGTNWAEIKEWDKNNSGISVSKLEVNNSPVSKVRISSLEKRGRGGRAYKVIITLPNKSELFYVDLREDVLMDTILEKGIDKKGILKGDFIWARVDTDMKLIRVGSKLHDKMIESTKLNSVKISKSKLEVGGVYSNKHHTKVYLGEFATVNCTQKTIETIRNNNNYSWRKEYDLSYEYSFEIVRKTQLWCANDYSNNITGYHSASSIINSRKLISNLSDLIEHQNYACCFEQVVNKKIKSKDSQLIIDCKVIDSIHKLGNELINSKPIQQYYPNCSLVHLTEVGKPIQVNDYFKQFPELISKVEEYNSTLK